MKIWNLLLLGALLLTACGGSGSRTQASARQAATAPAAQPVNYTFRVKNTFPHSVKAYTQGLQYVDGVMWEGTGLHGESVIQTVDLATGKTRKMAELPRAEFGEGITIMGDSLFQLTWQENTCHLYRIGDEKLEKIRDFRYMGEGWGLTTDGHRLFMSDGSENITVLRPGDFRRERRFTVTLNGEPLYFINELEWIEGRIWANVYTTQQIVIIDPRSGVVEGVIDLTGLLPEQEQTSTTDVLNGIAYDREQRRIFVTGKNWSKIFEIEIIRQ